MLGGLAVVGQARGVPGAEPSRHTMLSLWEALQVSVII